MVFSEKRTKDMEPVDVDEDVYDDVDEYVFIQKDVEKKFFFEWQDYIIQKIYVL